MASVKTISASQLSELNSDNFLSFIHDKNESLFVGELKYKDWRKQVNKSQLDVLSKDLLLKKSFIEQLNDVTREALFVSCEAGLNIFPIELKHFDFNKVTVLNPKKGNGNLPLDTIFTVSLSNLDGVLLFDNGKKIYHINIGRTYAYNLTELLDSVKLLIASKSDGGKFRSKFKKERSEVMAGKSVNDLIKTVINFEASKVDFDIAKINFKKGKFSENHNLIQTRNKSLLAQILPIENKLEIGDLPKDIK